MTGLAVMREAQIGGGMVPFYFGSPDKPLYGCYHEPRSGPDRGCGVILCAPLWFEYIYSHRAYRQLAARLCRAGFPTLQFDYYGSGDSGGDIEQGGLLQRLIDISTAIDEMRKRSGLAKVCLIGLRMGGTLSMMCGAERGDLEHLVLWDPVVSGKDYIREMRAVHTERLGWLAKPKGGSPEGTYGEILGYPLTRSIVAELERVDIRAIRWKPANHTLAIVTSAKGGTGGLRKHLESTTTRLEYQELHGPRIWLPDREGGLLVPNQILQAVVSWMSGVQP